MSTEKTVVSLLYDLEVDDGVRAEHLPPGAGRAEHEPRRRARVNGHDLVEHPERVREGRQSSRRQQQHTAIGVSAAQTRQGRQREHQAAAAEHLDDDDAPPGRSE